MSEPHDSFEVERNTLRLLCAECLDAKQRNAMCAKLQPEIFLDSIHRVLFEEICALQTADAHRLRELLPARLTNRGFPDADLETFLSPGPVPNETFDAWVRGAESLAAKKS